MAKTITKIEYIDSIDSTSSELRRRIPLLDNGHLLIAKYQTKGRGRRDNVWHSAPNQNLTFSIYFKASKITTFDMLVNIGVSIVDTLQEYHLSPTIKLPNDILINGKKIAGILIETIKTEQENHMIIGIGLNVNELMNSDIDYQPLSMRMITEKRHDLDDVLNRLISNLERNIGLNTFNVFKDYVMKTPQMTIWKGQEGRLIDFNKQFVCKLDINGEIFQTSCSQLTFYVNQP